MLRAVLTPALLLAVLIQTVVGGLARHSHPAAPAADQAAVVKKTHDHHHAHGHHHGHGKPHRHHAPTAPHFHFGGEAGEEHQHEESGGDAESYVVSRLAAFLITFDAVGHIPFEISDDLGQSAARAIRQERTIAYGRSSWPSGQRLSLLGVWLI